MHWKIKILLNKEKTIKSMVEFKLKQNLILLSFLKNNQNL